VLGFRRSGSYSTPQQTSVTVFEVGPGGAGAEVHVEIHPELPFAALLESAVCTT